MGSDTPEVRHSGSGHLLCPAGVLPAPLSSYCLQGTADGSKGCPHPHGHPPQRALPVPQNRHKEPGLPSTWRAAPDTRDVSNHLCWTETSRWCWTSEVPPRGHPADTPGPGALGGLALRWTRGPVPPDSPKLIPRLPEVGAWGHPDLCYSHGRICSANCSVTRTEGGRARPTHGRAWVTIRRRGQGPRESVRKKDAQRRGLLRRLRVKTRGPSHFPGERT